MGREPNTMTTLEIRRLTGKRIMMMRSLRQATQAAVIKDTTISQPHLSRIEKGERPLEVEEAFAIADFFGVTLDLLFRGKPKSDDDMPMALNLLALDKELVEVPVLAVS